MGIECSYSFWDLFSKAYGRGATEKEKKDFFALTQDARNELVKQWADLASWEIDERVGTDGKIYTAFAPTFSPEH